MLRPPNKKNSTTRITICTRICSPTHFGSLITAETIQSSCKQTCIWNLPSLAPEIPRKILPWDSSSPRLSGTETRTIPECVLQVAGAGRGGKGGVCPKGDGFVISLECLLRERCYLRTTLCHPVHLGDAPGDGTLLTEALLCVLVHSPKKINKSITVHSSPHPSSIHEDGKKPPPNSC